MTAISPVQTSNYTRGNMKNLFHAMSKGYVTTAEQADEFVANAGKSHYSDENLKTLLGAIHDGNVKTVKDADAFVGTLPVKGAIKEGAKGLSKGAKIGIGAAIAAALGLGGYLVKTQVIDKKAQEEPQKLDLAA